MALTIDDGTIKKFAPLVTDLLGGAQLGASLAPTAAPKLPDFAPTSPPMPTPAQEGFDAFAADPQHQERAQKAVTIPGQPIFPPTPASPSATPQLSIPDLGSTQPQAYGAYTTAPSPFPMPSTQAGWGAVTGPAAPAVGSQFGDVQPLNDAMTRYNAVAETKAGVDRIHNPWLRTIAKIGDVAGSIVAPGVASFIPGTTLNHIARLNLAGNDVSRAYDQLNAGAKLSDTQAQIQQRQATANNKVADTGLKDAKTDAIPVDQARKQGVADAKLEQAYKKMGYKQVQREDGTSEWVPDRESPQFQHQQILDEATQVREQLQKAQTEVERAKNDPNSPAYKLAVRKLAVAQSNATAAQTRARAYMGNYLQHAYNVGQDGNVLPGAPIITGDDGREVAVGSTNASNAIKAQSNAAQYNDVHGALDNVEGAARALAAQNGGRLNTPGVIAALTGAHDQHGGWVRGGVSNYLRGANAASLTPQERAYVLAVESAHENVQALRKAAGGTATDSSVAKLDALIPGAATPNIDYLLGQTGQIRSTAERLGKGAVRVQGGLSVRREGQSGGSGNVAPEGTRVRMADGTTQVKRGGKWVKE